MPATNQAVLPCYRHTKEGSTFLTIPVSPASFAIIDDTGTRQSYELKMDSHSGDVVHNLQNHSGHYHTVTSVNEVEGWLWLGSLIQPYAARIPVPQAN
jgi:hypothetical protein